MNVICTECGAKFVGDYALGQYNRHKRIHDKTPASAIYDDAYVDVYDVLPKEYGDSACCRLMNVETGECLVDGDVFEVINRTNICTFAIDRLIGKRIRIKCRAEIVEC